MLGKSSIFDNDVDCDKESGKIILDPNDIQQQLEFVKKFIKEHGRVYDYDIIKCIESFGVSENYVKSLVDKRRSMYEGLSKL